ETSVVGSTFREQLVQILVPLRLPANLLFRDREVKFGNGDSITIRVGLPSPIFVNFFRLRKEQSAFLRERLDRPSNGGGRVREVFDRMITIRIDFAEPLTEGQINSTTTLFESCLFELSYMRNISLQLQNEWPSFADRRRRFIPGRAIGRELPLKQVQYDIPAVRFYQRGVATDDAYIQFISFYHVLEYYFISVSDDICTRNYREF